MLKQKANEKLANMRSAQSAISALASGIAGGGRIGMCRRHLLNAENFSALRHRVADRVSSYPRGFRLNAAFTLLRNLAGYGYCTRPIKVNRSEFTQNKR